MIGGFAGPKKCIFKGVFRTADFRGIRTSNPRGGMSAYGYERTFSQADGSPMSPNNLSRDWRRLVISRKFPRVSFHRLRHSHVSALIDGGLDVFSVSRRIGHGSVALTLRTHSHLFSKQDTEAADAIEAALRTRAER